jgi:hypothetical protein
VIEPGRQPKTAKKCIVKKEVGATGFEPVSTSTKRRRVVGEFA